MPNPYLTAVLEQQQERRKAAKKPSADKPAAKAEKPATKPSPADKES